MTDVSIIDRFHSQFKCHRCGSCCSHGGQIRITPAEAQLIADYLGIDMGDMSLFPFTAQSDDPDYLYLEVTDPCFFWDKMTCEGMINEVKPAMCLDYPWKLYQDSGCTFLDVILCPVAFAQLNALLNSR